MNNQSFRDFLIEKRQLKPSVNTMSEKPIKLSKEQQRWVQEQIDSGSHSDEYAVIDEMINEQREIAYVRKKLKRSEQLVAKYGHSTKTKEDLLNGALERMRKDGRL